MEYSTDIIKILELGVLGSPVFVINGEIITAGKIPSLQEIEGFILQKMTDTECCKNTNRCDVCTPIKNLSSGGCCCGEIC